MDIKIIRLLSLYNSYFSPFERTDEENNQLYEKLITFDSFINALPPTIRGNKYLLEQLCAQAQLEKVVTKTTPGK